MTFDEFHDWIYNLRAELEEAWDDEEEYTSSGLNSTEPSEIIDTILGKVSEVAA